MGERRSGCLAGGISPPVQPRWALGRRGKITVEFGFGGLPVLSLSTELIIRLKRERTVARRAGAWQAGGRHASTCSRRKWGLTGRDSRSPTEGVCRPMRGMQAKIGVSLLAGGVVSGRSLHGRGCRHTEYMIRGTRKLPLFSGAEAPELACFLEGGRGDRRCCVVQNRPEAPRRPLRDSSVFWRRRLLCSQV